MIAEHQENSKSFIQYIRQTPLGIKILLLIFFCLTLGFGGYVIYSLSSETKALLKVIQDKKAKHKKRYFNRYRSISLDKEQNKLITYDAILSRRLDYLVKLISIQ